MHKFKTEQIGATWFAHIQVHIFADSVPRRTGSVASWQWGPCGQGATVEEAMADALRLTRESLAKTLAGLV